MSEWWTYRLSDFLMFSSRTYYRLFELYNTEAWPGHLLALAAGLVLLALAARPVPHGRRIAAGMLAAAWLWVAWGYFHRYYATIHWAGDGIAAAFAVEAGLLLVSALAAKAEPVPGRTDAGGWVGAVLFALAVCGYPFAAPLLGRPWAQAELFGMAPNPTAAATLGLVLRLIRRPWGLLPIPLLWLAYSGATLWVMGSGES
jgi:hypothetical protein